MSEEEPLLIDCDRHGKQIAAVVCRHMLAATEESVGFVENNYDPSDLQAWCDVCERVFQEAGDQTDFHQVALVCVACYAELKARHSR